MRDLVDETDGIDEHDLVGVRQTERTRGRIESGEQFVFDKDPGSRERVHQSGFACIGVADESNRDEREFIPFFSMECTSFLDHFETSFERADAFADPPTVDFELCLTGSAGSDTATKPGKVRPLTG